METHPATSKLQKYPWLSFNQKTAIFHSTLACALMSMNWQEKLVKLFHFHFVSDVFNFAERFSLQSRYSEFKMLIVKCFLAKFRDSDDKSEI